MPDLVDCKTLHENPIIYIMKNGWTISRILSDYGWDGKLNSLYNSSTDDLSY